jgi:hypothetical protein
VVRALRVGGQLFRRKSPSEFCSGFQLATEGVERAVVRANQNSAGMYGSVTRIGRLAVGQTIRLER